ncbi:MAG: hypothetical protein ACI959_000426 [Limisphaerales bacterium]|jgi:hypothetical protein
MMFLDKLIIITISLITLSVNGQVSFTALDIDAGDYYDMAAHDFDSDGDIDIISVNFGASRIEYFKRSAGTYSSTPITIDNVPDHPKTIIKGDLNADGLMDIVVGSNFDGRVQWYPNTGSGFGPRQMVSTSTPGINRVRTADIDGDGDFDILAASTAADKLSWFENDGAGTTWTEHIISITVTNCVDLDFGDLNNDGNLDVVQVSSLDNTLSWFSNLGSGVFGPEQILVGIAFVDPLSVIIADFENDGDLDIAAMTNTSNQVFWLRGLGDGTFSNPILISTDINQGRRLDIGDLDNDGDIDLISASKLDSKYAWYENLGGNFGSQHIISNSYLAAYYPKAVDLDLDGDLDVIGGSTGAGATSLTIFENNLINICPEPILLFSFPTSTGVTFNWEADIDHTAFQIKGFEAGISAPVNINTTSSTWSSSTGLSPLTDYAWKLRAQCSSSFISSWTPLQTFSTPMRLAENDQLGLYPNPTDKSTYLKLDGQKAYSIIQINGQYIGNRNLILENQEIIEIQTENLNPGLYRILLENKDGSLESKSLIIQH